MKNKTEALERLSALEIETKQLRKIIETSDTPRKITDIVNSFLDAVEYLPKDDVEIRKYKTLSSVLDPTDWILAVQRLVIICKALNEGKELTMADKRHYPYYNVSSGFAFNGTTYDVACAFTTSASRLCVDSAEKAIHLGKKFLPEMKAAIAG